MLAPPWQMDYKTPTMVKLSPLNPRWTEPYKPSSKGPALFKGGSGQKHHSNNSTRAQVTNRARGGKEYAR
eukprot:1384046-Pyramimonas_sp.AAC.1